MTLHAAPPPDRPVADLRSQEIFDAVLDRSWPKAEWDHEAHLRVCWVALLDHDPIDAVPLLRTAIRTYNEATGVENTPTSGYHETLTRYFVGAVASVDAPSIDGVLAAPQCQVGAPLRHWSRDVLFTPAARADWVEPDLLALAPAVRAGAIFGPGQVHQASELWTVTRA